MATSWQSALVMWDPPQKANGVITHYMITVERNSTKVSPQDHMYMFMKLLANTSYVFKIRASTSAGEGDESSCDISTLPETGNYAWIMSYICQYHCNIYSTFI